MTAEGPLIGSPTSVPAVLARIVALAVTYALIGRLGLLVEPVAGFATLVWPPSGIALAALVWGGRGLWPGVALGALAVNLWIGGELPVAVALAAGNTLAALLAAHGLALASFDPRTARVRDVLALIVIGAGLSTLASASIGVGALHAAGAVAAADTWFLWRAWWLGDAMGDLVAAPLLLVWISSPPDLAELGNARARAVETIAVAALTIVAGLVVFGGVLAPAHGARSMYLLFPPLVWSAARFGPRGATGAVATISVIAVLGTMAGHGPFTRGGALPESLLELQSFMAVVAGTLLILGAAIAERDRARLAALDAASAREEFVSIASHELRTPLSALVIQIGMLQRRVAKTEDGAGLAPALGRAERQTQRLTQLLDHLLDSTRIDAGQLAIVGDSGDLAEMIRDLVDRMQEQAAQAGCEVRAELATPIPGQWDRMRIEQIATNLLANAFRYAPGAPVEVAVVAEGDVAVLTVRDHGPGIEPGRLEEIFGRYQRGGAPRKRGGLGLGLYIVRHVVLAHGGTIVARRAEGGGMVFEVRLPRSRGR